MRCRDDHSGIETNWHRDDRGVSEVVAFVLVFGIILSSIAILSVTGFQAMDDYQEFEQQENAARAMGALSENFNDVLRYDGIDQRYGELALRGGTISTGSDGTTLSISAEGDGGEDFSDDIELGEFSYESGSSTLYYEGGAVVRESDGGGAVVLEEPKLTYNEDSETAIVSLVEIDAEERSIQSSESTGFTLSVEDRETTVINEADEIEITTTGERAAEWDEEIEKAWNGENELKDDDIETIVITIVEVDIEY
ncbi:DUF7289 family protein [Halobiforma nitratireducens]|uniref:Uncharacterized protein n=1 Tax=Halobiforma nitratireducens JCM 10879 TaxID=1227454 RepID=M0MAX6_9EURY|nr:hypothetical protein [Halobiforma nitratireducens]EMA42942.1 hypothetical protein C446_03811 [Halobiforma nitratireducens JCM 10879]